MTVDALMTKMVETCSPGDSLNRAAQVMWEKDCGCVPVIDGGILVGILTDRDVCMAAYTKGKALFDIRVDEVMSRDVKVCAPGDALEAVESVMQRHQLRRLPVVNLENRLVGIISLTDLVAEAEAQRNAKMKEHHRHLVEATLAAVSRPRAGRATA